MVKEIKLLVIEGDSGIQKKIKKALKSSFLDIKADYVINVIEAVKLSETKRWDIVLTNFNSPKNNGVETIRFFKDKKKRNIPVVVVADSNDEIVAQEVFDCGAYEIIVENLITPEGVGLIIRNALRLSRQQEQTNQLIEGLKHREKKFKEIQKLSGLGSWELSVGSKEIIWTEENSKIFGEKLIKRLSLDELYKMVVQKDREQLGHLFNLIFEKGIGFERTIGFNASNNQIVYVFIRAKCKIDDGELSSVYGTMMDVSHQKAVERYLKEEKLSAERLAKTKQDFLANMSHEIRTPMNSILGFTEIVLENKLDANLRDKMTRIKTSGENLLVIINDILDLTRIESEQLEIENIEYDLHDVLNHVIIQLESLANNKNINLIINIDKKIPTMLLGDPVRLGQVLINLVNNALKFTEKGSVEIRVKPALDAGCGKIQFEIEDTGIGISKLNQDSIFESYIQESSSTNRKYGGTGLGLSISKKLVHLLGGEIWVESQENIGSTFYFTIVNENRGDIQPKMQSQNTHKIDLKGLNLLLVEDNSINRELVIYFLNEWKVNFQVAVNGKEGIEMARMTDFDLILMDLSMPLIDGYQATKEIRLFDTIRKSTPIMAMTANVFNDDIEKCLDSGMNDYISKPFRAEELKLKIYNLVKGNRNLSITENDVHALKSKDIIEEQIFSLDLLKEMGGNNKGFINDMIRIYIEESPKTLDKLNSALEYWDVESIKSAAHKLRSPSAMMGVSKAVELTEFIEFNVFESEKKDEVKLAIVKLVKLINLVIEQAKAIS